MGNSNDHTYKRIRTLAQYGEKPLKNESKISTFINSVKSDDGSSYGIIKENHHYYIKRTSKKENLNESDFAYIGGVENSSKYMFGSVGEAEKQRNLLVKSINESISLTPTKTVINEDKTVIKEEKITNPFDFLNNRINEGKRVNSLKMQNKFKDSLSENKEITKKKAGLLPEAADLAIKRALGKINEETLATADSEISDADMLANKTGKESPQAPINDSNAKAKADSGNAQPSELTTADSEINTSDAMSNKNDTKESPQAPINDSNAKSQADKATGNSGSMEEPKKEGGSIIVNEEKDISTADSEILDKDAMPDQTGHETPQAPYNSYNQPNKGHTDGAKKGEELKPKESKKDIVAEENLTTADSEIVDGDVMSNKNDSKETPQAPVNDSNAKSQADNATGNSGSMEEPKKEPKAIVNEDLGNDELPVPPEEIQIDATLVDEDEETQSNLDAAANALDDLDIAIDQTEETPVDDVVPSEVPSEPAVDAPEGGDIPVDDNSELPLDDAPEGDVPVDDNSELGGDELPLDDAPEGDDVPDSEKEIEKLVGKLTQKVRTTDMTPEQTQSYMNSILTAFKNELGDVDIEQRKDMSSKIINATSDGSDETPEGEDTTEETSVVSGMDKNAESALDDQIGSLDDNVEEAAEPCDSCGEFNTYINDRGYEDLGECSEVEMASLVSSFANAHNDGENNGDLENVAKYITPTVKTELEEYGHGDYLSKLDPFMKNISEDQKVSFGSVEPMVSDLGEDDEKIDDVVDSVVDDAISSGVEIPDEAEVEVPSLETPDETPNETPEIGFANDSEVLGVATPSNGKTKSVDVDLESGKVNVTVSESEQKIRNYIKNRLLEKKGLKKSTINESKKTPALVALDKQIDLMLESHEAELTEGIFDSKKKRFEKINPNDDAGITDFIAKSFPEMRGQYKGAITKSLNSMTPEEKYSLLTVAYKDNFNGILRIGNNRKLQYVDKSGSGKYYGNDLGSPKLGN